MKTNDFCSIAFLTKRRHFKAQRDDDFCLILLVVLMTLKSFRRDGSYDRG